MDKKYDITADIQEFLTETNITIRPMNNEDKSTVFNILEKTGFYSKTSNKGLNSARLKDAFYELPKTVAKKRNPLLALPLAEVEESEEKSDNFNVKK